MISCFPLPITTFLDKQCKGSSSRETHVERADDEEDDRTRETETFQGVGNWAQHQNEKAAVDSSDLV